MGGGLYWGPSEVGGHTRKHTENHLRSKSISCLKFCSTCYSSVYSMLAHKISLNFQFLKVFVANPAPSLWEERGRNNFERLAPRQTDRRGGKKKFFFRFRRTISRKKKKKERIKEMTSVCDRSIYETDGGRISISTKRSRSKNGVEFLYSFFGGVWRRSISRAEFIGVLGK